MAAVINNRQTQALEPQFQHLGLLLVLLAQFGRGLEVGDRGRSTGGNRWRQGRGKDETRRVRPDGVAHLGRGRDIATHHAVGLGKRPVDDIQPVHQAITLGNPCPTRAIHPDGVDLVDIGQRAEFIGNVANRLDRAEIAIHRVNRFKGDQLGCGGIIGGHKRAQVLHIVMAEDTLGPAIAADPFDHRRVVQLVGIDDQTGKQLGQRAERRVIGDIGTGEQQGGFLAVQVRQLFLKTFVVNRGARDIARPARPCTRRIKCFVHRGQNDRVLPHP